MDRCENFNSQKMRKLVLAQTVFATLTLILGTVQFAFLYVRLDAGPFIFSILQIAPIVCGFLASREKSKCTIVASMGLNILTAIIGSFGQICYSTAFAVRSFALAARSSSYDTSGELTTSGALCIPLMLFGLPLFIINIRAAALGYVCCHSQPKAVSCSEKPIPAENVNSQRMRHLVIAQTVFTALTLLLGTVHAVMGFWYIFSAVPIICSVFQIAPIVCGFLALRENIKCTIVASLVLNILSAIFAGVGQTCFGIAYVFITLFKGHWPSNAVHKIFGFSFIFLALFGLTLLIINIWAAVLGCVSCHSQRGVLQYVATGGYVVVMQTKAYGQAPGTNMQKYPLPSYPRIAGVHSQPAQKYPSK